MPTGEPIRELSKLLRELRPRLNAERIAYAALTADRPIPDVAIGWFREAEGETVLLPAAAAREAGLRVIAECAWITLDVHSAIEAVGMTAAVARALTAEGIPCNVVAAIHHDHLFVPPERAADAMAALERLRSGTAG